MSGADLVGKVEAGIPEDDPRNPATIADNVGDNVGDCAGMASDLFESFGVVLVANIILGVTAFNAIGIEGDEAVKGLIFPLAMMGVGLLASMVSIYLVRARPGETDALKPINRGLNIASLIMLVGAAIIAFGYVGNPEGWPMLSGVGTRMFAADRRRRDPRPGGQPHHPVLHLEPVQAGAGHRRSRAHRARDGHPLGHLLAAWSPQCGRSWRSRLRSSWDSDSAAATPLFAVYLVALTGIGMLSTTGIVVAEDTFGPIADNAQGIAEMSDILEGDTETILDGLDTVGNTTKAVTKGFAIGSAVIAAVALFAELP